MSHKGRLAKDLEGGNQRETYSSRGWCREYGTVAFYTSCHLSADLHVWEEAAIGPSTFTAPAGSSDSASLTSRPSACLVPRQKSPLSLVKWPHLRGWKFGETEREKERDWQEFQSFLVVSGLASQAQAFSHFSNFLFIHPSWMPAMWTSDCNTRHRNNSSHDYYIISNPYNKSFIFCVYIS